MYRHRKGGFTLIELLVVIAIIAVLMSILLPALRRVKEQARTVACSSLLKQWGVWFSMYTDDHTGSFMEGWQGSSRNNGDGNIWCTALGGYYDFDVTNTCCPSAKKPWIDESGLSNEYEGTHLGSTTAWGYWQR